MKMRMLAAGLLFTAFLAAAGTMKAYAENADGEIPETDMEGALYSFRDADDEYEISSYKERYVENPQKIEEGTDYGRFFLQGNVIPSERDFEDTDTEFCEHLIPGKDIPAYEITDGSVGFHYTLRDVYGTETETELHYENDKAGSVDGFELRNRESHITDIFTPVQIKSGAIIVQTSIDGRNWVTDAVFTDVVNSENETDNIYTTKALYQDNGCYYRVIAAYRLGQKIGEKHYITIGGKNFITKDEYSRVRVAEVYTFYMISRGATSFFEEHQAAENSWKLTNEEDKRVRVKDEFVKPETDDPHRDWEIGTFYIDGYTDYIADEADEQKSSGGEKIFLKNAGDSITLWFELKQDIDRLNDRDDLTIGDVTDGNDPDFEGIPQDFGRGMLIIRRDDRNGRVKPDVYYRNYLSACSVKGACTHLELNEEGDYTIALDYRVIEDKLIDEVHDYRLVYSFKIRNGNNMIFLFDLKNGNELHSSAIAEKGFRLDLAGSQYLKVNVKREEVILTGKRYVMDLREDRISRDNNEYTAHGIYTITVNNEYTGGSESKIYYVGDEPVLKALAKGLTLEEINFALSVGAELLDDGSIQYLQLN